MQYADHILEKYESRPRKWWQYLLVALILALLLSWSASSITFKGLAAKGAEVAKGIFWGLVKPDMSMLLTTAGGYALSKDSLPGRNAIFFFFILTMFFSGGLVPYYIVVRKQQEANNGDIVVAMIDDSATVKRYYKEDGRFRLQPENHTMAPIYTREITILGKVISLYRLVK